MKRIGILTTGGDTPALNATIHGAVQRANQLRIEVYGLMKGFNCLFNPRMPHVRLNPLFTSIPELDETLGGTIIGASRDFVDSKDRETLDLMYERLKRLNIDGVVCIGGDGSLNGLQPLAERVPCVLAPKTIDNDLGMNFQGETDHWVRDPAADSKGYHYRYTGSDVSFDPAGMVNYVTPGYATAVYVAVSGVQRIRTTAESHRRIAIVEVMGRHSGYIALGAAYGQPDITLIPESPVNMDAVVEKVKERYALQKHVVICCGEGIIDENGNELGAKRRSTDPAGNIQLTGASEELASMLMERLGDDYFRSLRRGATAREAIFTRKIGHTQRGGRPLQFDRFYAAQLGGKSVDMLLEGQNNSVAVLQWNTDDGFHLDSIHANTLRDRWGHIHARRVHPDLYDAKKMRVSAVGARYLRPIFSSAIGHDDVEAIRHQTFDNGNLYRPFHSVNTDMSKRIEYLED
jgi:6-phosphofructokinase 1